MDDSEKIYEKNTAVIAKLHTAIASGKTSAVKATLEKHPNLLDFPLYGLPGHETLLHLAAESGQTEICKLLVAMGLALDTSAASSGDSTPLSGAARNGHLETCKWLLDAGARVDGWPTSNTTPLMEAVISGNQEGVDFFVKCGADINRLHSRLNTTPLDIANSWDLPDIALILKGKGAVSVMDVIREPESEYGSAIVSFVHNTAGWVLPGQVSPVTTIENVDLRISCIDSKNKFKLLFTIGLFNLSPKTELFFCLPGDWPLTRTGFNTDSPWAFPTQMLSRLANETLENGSLKEGQLIRRTDPTYSDLAWPTDIDALVTVDKVWSKNSSIEPIPDEDKVILYVLAPLKFTKKGAPDEAALTALAESKRTASWAKLCIGS
ncbi:ankyrin repeat domain-containing protein [Pseudomonas gingeri]|uniref:Ankyrin repeat domain-containing protein n=1 Tax=Pseudomonas gingeri TaxID=117681 RepID=A0A7Y8C208_9PSED|nr:ankyrin repeat domain-containing protein [Pseudomonas gingeri]NWB96079.1 ankyrin repeat domain-containing protein [Pseudomonas gingeri]